MFIDLFSESWEERGRDFFYWVTKMNQYFKGMFFLISLNFDDLLQATSLKTHKKLIGLGGMPLFIWSYLRNVRKWIIVLIIKHHTYTHHIFRLYKHTQTFQRLLTEKNVIHYLLIKCKKLNNLRQVLNQLIVW